MSGRQDKPALILKGWSKATPKHRQTRKNLCAAKNGGIRMDDYEMEALLCLI